MFIFFFLCSIPFLLWFPIILYLTWILVWDKAPENGGRPIRWLRNAAWWKLFAGYFPAHIIKVKPLSLPRVGLHITNKEGKPSVHNMKITHTHTTTGS
jgi:2-acylglycerol O-acyltransferase 2